MPVIQQQSSWQVTCGVTDLEPVHVLVSSVAKNADKKAAEFYP
jgi:hypothetical protein